MNRRTFLGAAAATLAIIGTGIPKAVATLPTPKELGLKPEPPTNPKPEGVASWSIPLKLGTKVITGITLYYNDGTKVKYTPPEPISLMENGSMRLELTFPDGMLNLMGVPVLRATPEGLKNIKVSYLMQPIVWPIQTGYYIYGDPLFGHEHIVDV